MVDRSQPKYRKIVANAQVNYRARRRVMIHEMKKNLSCVYCGTSNPLCIDFDHIDRSSKAATPATMITGGYKWEDVLAEIEKCQPVCANCHRMKSILESDKMKAIEEDIFQYVPQKMRDEFLHAYCVPPEIAVDSGRDIESTLESHTSDITSCR